MKTMFLMAAVTFLMAAVLMAVVTSRRDSWRLVVTTWTLLSVGIAFTMITIYL